VDAPPVQDEASPSTGDGRRRPSAATVGWVTALAVLGGAIAWVVLTGMRPSFDAYGWLVWGKQSLRGDLNLNGAPSWKPLTFLFTLPYAFFGDRQPGLWMVTATAGGLATGVFAARIAFTLTDRGDGRPWAPFLAAGCAAIGVLGLGGYWHLVLISSSDPLVVALCLAAIDFHLRDRTLLAYSMLVAAALARPETWLFVLGYAVWAWLYRPGMRTSILVSVLLIPAAWFVIPALSSRSWFSAGTLALDYPGQIHGNKIVGVWNRFIGLYSTPMQIAWVVVVGLALLLRDLRALALILTAGVWVIIEIGFAYHGWPAVPRYLMEPAAVLTVLVAVAIGRAVAFAPAWPVVLRWLAPLAAVALIATLVPTYVQRVRQSGRLITAARGFALRINNLHAVILADGGAARIRSCGRPVTVLGYQSTLAWEVDMNVWSVGFRPGLDIRRGAPIVLFKPHGTGWSVRPIHTSPRNSARCAALRTEA
jgi:hypothetical protein